MASELEPSPGKLNATRVDYFIKYVFTPLLRDIFKRKNPEKNFVEFLRKNKKIFLDPENFRFREDEKKKLYPGPEEFARFRSADIDVTLWYTLIKYCGFISPKTLFANIKEIKNDKNVKLSHSVSPLTDQEFETTWNRYNKIIEEILWDLKDHEMTEKYREATTKLKKAPLDPNNEVDKKNLEDELKEIADRLIGVEEGLSCLKQTFEENHSESTGRLVALEEDYATLEEHRSESTGRLVALEEDCARLEEHHSESTGRLVALEEDCARLEEHRSESTGRLVALEEDYARLEEHRSESTGRLVALEEDCARLGQSMEKDRKRSIATIDRLLKNHKSGLYIETSAVTATKDKLKKRNVVILTGKAGSGKTTTAYEVMCKISTESYPYTPVLITSPKEWKKVIKRNQQYLVLLDDFIGKTNLDEEELDRWSRNNMLDVILLDARAGDIYLIIGLRKNVLDAARVKSKHKIFHKENEVDLSQTYKLTEGEKLDILATYEEHYKRERNTYEVLAKKERKKIVNTDPFYGYPLTCALFFSDMKNVELGSSFFKRPDQELMNLIGDKRKLYATDTQKIEFAVLCVVFIRGHIAPNCIDKELLGILFQRLSLSNAVNVGNEDNVKAYVTDACKELRRYLSEDTATQSFTFTHETILEAVLLSFGEMAPDLVITHCRKWQLRELVRTQNYQPKEGEVVLNIPRRHYENLVQRFIRGDDGNGVEVTVTWTLVRDIVFHPAFSDHEFVRHFLNLEMNDRLVYILRRLWDDFHSMSSILLSELLERYGPHCDSTKFAITEKNIFDKIKFTFTHLKHDYLLCVAKYIRNHKYLHYLLDKGLDDSGEYYPIHECVQNNWEDIVEIILKIHKPRTTYDGWSCAHLAAYAGQQSLLQKVLNYENNFPERTRNGFSVLQATFLGLRYGYGVQKEPNINSEIYISYHTEVDFPEEGKIKSVIEFLLQKGDLKKPEDIGMAVDIFENNIVHYLVMHDYREILDLLIYYNREILNHRNRGDLPTTLHVAVFLGRHALVKKFLDLGVGPSSQDLSLWETLDIGKSLQSKRLIAYKYHGLYNKDKTTIWKEESNEKNGETNDVPKCKLLSILNVNVQFGGEEDFQFVRKSLENIDCSC